MIATIVAALVVAYLVLMVLAFWYTSRPQRAIALWWASLVLAVVLTALAVAQQYWLNAGLWVFNVALDALHIHLARRRQARDEADEYYTA